QRLLRPPALGNLIEGGDVAEDLAAVAEHRRRAHAQPAPRPRPGHDLELVGERLLADDGAQPVADEAVAVLRPDVARPALAERLVGAAAARRLRRRVAEDAAPLGVEDHQPGRRVAGPGAEAVGPAAQALPRLA